MVKSETSKNLTNSTYFPKTGEKKVSWSTAIGILIILITLLGKFMKKVKTK